MAATASSRRFRRAGEICSWPHANEANKATARKAQPNFMAIRSGYEFRPKSAPTFYKLKGIRTAFVNGHSGGFLDLSKSGAGQQLQCRHRLTPTSAGCDGFSTISVQILGSRYP